MRLRKTVAMVFAAVVALIALGQPTAEAKKLNVVVSTTLLQSAVKDIGGEHVDVDVLVAPGSCPGHYDICPQDIRKLSSSKLILTHGYEGFVDNILKAMGKNKPKLIKISTTGNWMVPNVYVRAAKLVTDALCKDDPKNSDYYRKSFSSVKTNAQKMAAQMLKKSKTRGTSRISVLCSNQQEEFVKWMGFKVIDTYARAEEFSPVKLHKLTAEARKKHVQLVIDNLQSGPTAGKQLAKDVGAAHVTLSNFPGGFSGTETWTMCFKDNVSRLIKGIEKK